MRRITPVLLLLAVSACGTTPQPANTNSSAAAPGNTPAVAPADPTVPVPFTASSLVETQSADPAAFKEKYLGRDLELSGTVESIVTDEKDPDHVRGLRLAAPTKADPKGTLLCSFPEQKKVMKGSFKLKAGDQAKFKGSLIGNAEGLEIRITTLY